MKKGAIYARYSSDRQSGETIKTQVDKCREFCERQDILVCETFVDEAKTGTTEEGREAYALMLDMAGKGFFNVIVAYKYDRIGRSFVETVRSIYDLERYYNVAVYSATEPNEPLVRNILLSVAENFSRQLSARIHDALISNAGQGFHCGGAPPYGYVGVRAPSGRTDRKGNPVMHVTLEVEPEQAAIVRRIYREYGDGLSMAQIARRLNAEGVATPDGDTWDRSGIQYILSNEVYRGWRVWNRRKKLRKPDGKMTFRVRPRSEWIITKDAHPAIVDDDLWNAAEGTRQRVVRYRQDKGGGLTFYSKYLLTGLIKCEECGSNFISHGILRKGKIPYAYYRCGYHDRRGDSVCANSANIQKDRLEGAVLDLLQREILTKQTVKMLIEDVRKAWDGQKDGAKEELGRAERELRKVEREIANLVHAIKAGGISGTLKAELDRCEERKARLEQTRQELQQVRPQADRLPTPEEIAGALEGFRCLLESGTPQEKRAVLEENVTRMVAKKSGEVLLEATPGGFLSGRFFLLPLNGRRRKCQ
jgi:DNA invertase Pin-like site-specific DNA recombinase